VEVTLPNSQDGLAQKLSVDSLDYGWFSFTNHQAEGDKLNSSSNYSSLPPKVSQNLR